MNKKNYLTVIQIEDLKDACITSEERSIVRDLTDTGITLKDVIKSRSKSHPTRNA